MTDPLLKLKLHLIYLLGQENMIWHTFVYNAWHELIKIKTIPTLVISLFGFHMFPLDNVENGELCFN